ncbi:MAG: hypothetical protein IPK82_31620 [Polyangiaceae bacterium]|nr:hypothetical protein [Polyangiaceae bacterium]
MKPFRRALVYALFAEVTCVSPLGCTPEAGVEWDTEHAQERHREAAEKLREIGKGRFEVLSFQAGEESTRVLEDDFHARSLLYKVPFSARVRFLAEFTVLEQYELPTLASESNFNPESYREAVQLTLLLGPGKRPVGTEANLSALAVFEDLEPGVRFRVFDTER